MMSKKITNIKQGFKPVLQSTILCGLCGLTGCSTVSCQEFKCSFAKGQWDQCNWIVVRRPDWDCDLGGWTQKDDCIENKTPPIAKPKELIKKLAPQTHASMVLKEKFKGDITISAEMEFTDRMAPSIVIASELGKNTKGEPEYRKHLEVVLCDEGINVWHHVFESGKSSWKKTAYWLFSLKPNIRYTLEVKLEHSSKGKTVKILLDEDEFSYIDDTLADDFYVGITGCEGVNRFYNFSVSTTASCKK